MKDGRPLVMVETDIPRASRDIGMQIKRSQGVSLSFQYRRCVIEQVRRDAQTPLDAAVFGAEPERDGRFDPPLCFDDIEVLLHLAEADYAAMKASARLLKMRTRQYCRHAIVSHIASAPAEARDREAPADSASDEPNWLSLVL